MALREQKPKRKNKISLDGMDADEIERIIDQKIHSQRNRQIIKRRLIDGLSFCELSEEFHLTERQIQNIVYKAFKEFFKNLI